MCYYLNVQLQGQRVKNATERQPVLLSTTVSTVTILQRRWQANDMLSMELWCNDTAGTGPK